jgi:UV DNA damage endonuclease
MRKTIRLGYACVNVTLARKIRSLRLATLHAQGLPYLQQLVDENMDLLAEILRWNREHQISFFRISSDLVPLGSHKEVDLASLHFPRAQEIAALTHDMRISMHPGQYTLLSADGTVWENSLQDLRYHALLLDLFQHPAGDIVLHGGGVYGDREATAARIRAHILALPTSMRRHLRLENDERCWSVTELLPICEETRTPLIVDNLHHQLNGEMPLAELPWQRIQATWQGRRPKLHYSEQDPSKRPGAHSDYISAPAFLACQEQIPLEAYDVMLECKAKELALLRLRENLASLSSEECKTLLF